MTWFEQLEIHLCDLYLNSSSHDVDAFKPAFRSFFGEEHQTFRLKMFHNLDQLRQLLERENLLEVNARTCLEALRTQFKEFFASKGVNSPDYLNQCWQQDFKEYTLCKPNTYRRDLLENLDTLEAVIHRAVITYGKLQLQSQDVQINPVHAVDDSLSHESLVTECTTLEANLSMDVKALDACLVVTECSGTKSDKHITSSSSGNYITHAVDADIIPVNDQVPFTEVQLTAQHNVPANEQQHTDQSEPIYDTYLLEKIDSNTTPDSTNMCHRGGEIDQDAEQYQVKNSLLNAELFKMKDMVELEVYNELSNRFLQLEKHCISLEISIQQKEESFQSNKPSLKNELRKLKGNSVDTKFAKPSILGKPVLQPPINQSVARQPNAFKSERPNFSKPRFASQVDVNNVLSKPVTPHYLPKVREYVLAKPHHVIAPGSSRNSQEESYGSNDMAHNHYLEEARKKTQERNRNSKSSVMHTTSLQITTNGSKQKPRRNNQTSRSLPVSKSSGVTSNSVPLVDHSKNSSSFSDSKHFVCSTCQKCVFNANHDDCITKFLKEVNSRAKVQSPKSRNNIKPAKRIPNVNKPKRWISKGYQFSPNKSSAVHEKPNTPRSCLRWKPMGRIFKIVGLRWIPTGKMFIDSTTKVDSEPPNGSNEDITNPYECDQTLNAPLLKEKKGPEPQLMTPGTISSGLVQNIPSPTPAVPPTKIDWDSLFQPMFDEYFKPPPNVNHPVPTLVPTASTRSPSTTTVDQDAPSTSTSQTISEQQSLVIPQEPSSEETTLQGVIPSNLHHLNQSFDTLTKLTKKHPLENVIGDPSRSVSTRSQLQEHAI
ncbi:hypothetical protein Tco_0019309 [Tanacetum coccineum]